MLVLDENLPDSQQQLLRKWRVRFRVVGDEVASTGITDENILPVLLRLPRPTFFSLDSHFYRRDWMHSAYCLSWLDVRRRDAAEFIRRFLRHPLFDMQAKRMVVVARVHPGGIVFWRAGQRQSQTVPWLSR